MQPQEAPAKAAVVMIRFWIQLPHSNNCIHLNERGQDPDIQKHSKTILTFSHSFQHKFPETTAFVHNGSVKRGTIIGCSDGFI